MTLLFYDYNCCLRIFFQLKRIGCYILEPPMAYFVSRLGEEEEASAIII